MSNKEQEESLELKKVVNPKDSKLKKLFVNYVGKKLDPSDNEVTVKMIVNVMAEEFPEFLLAIAEENFIIGYKQALADRDAFDKMKEDGNVKCN